ncbi:hypothetical protein D3C78_1737340 [compost metagenome]
MSELSPSIAAKVEEIYSESVAILRRCLEQAQAVGELSAAEDCANLAEFVGNAWQGVLARLKSGASLKPMEAFITRLERLLQA